MFGFIRKALLARPKCPKAYLCWNVEKGLWETRREDNNDLLYQARDLLFVLSITEDAGWDMTSAESVA